MFAARTLRTSAAVLAALLAAGTIGAAPAIAGRPLPKPTGLAASVDAHPGGTYDVSASWDVSAGATSYRVTLTKGGTTLASKTVTTNAWSPTVSATPGIATLSVRAVAGRKPGKPASLAVPLADVTAPTGTYTSDWSDDTGVATITQTALADDSGTGGITRVVNWHDPSHPGTVNWTSGTTLQHTYDLTEARYVPTVTLEDAAHNQNVVDVPGVVIKDSAAPTGTFSVAPSTAWATLTTVTVTPLTLVDNWTPPADVSGQVFWGDGSSDPFTGLTPVTHVYGTGGTRTPTVTLSDEAHNLSGDLSTSAVVVSVDATGPKVKLTLPSAKHSVKAWKTLRGTATDAGTGVKRVWLKAVEKRRSGWFGYNAATHTWAKAATKTKAFKKAKPFNRTTNAQHRWTAKLAKLAKGTLVYKVRATDLVGNRSATITRTATLTKS
jgi:hypothetical protein